MFTLNGHLLVGTSPQDRPVQAALTQNHDGPIVAKFLVFHYTACTGASARATFLRQAGPNRVSAHLLVDRDGSVTQFVPLDLRAWHAGESSWDGFQDLNSHSIGIEVVNFGYLQKRADGSFLSADGTQQVLAADVVEGRHQLPRWPWTFWQGYTAPQIATCEALADLLVRAYALRDIVGHDDIAPTRKVDPGPAFPLAHIRSLALGRDSPVVPDQVAYVAADMLNIRTAPSADAAKAGAALARDTRLTVLARDPSGWTRVTTPAQPPVTGWVRSEYTRATPAFT